MDNQLSKEINKEMNIDKEISNEISKEISKELCDEINSEISKGINKENQFTSSLKRNCTNRHSLHHQKLDFKQSLNRFAFTKPILSTLSNSISSIPIIDRHQNEFALSTTSSDGAMIKKVKDLNYLIKTDNRLSPTTKHNFMISNFNDHFRNNHEPTTNHTTNHTINHTTIPTTNHTTNPTANKTRTTTINLSNNLSNSTATKRRASMLDNSMHGSGISPTKSKLIVSFFINNV